MMDLIFEVNEDVTAMLAEDAYIKENIDILAEAVDMNLEQLNEAITNWLAKVRNVASKGALDPKKKDSVVKILGVLSALSNPDLADALDEDGDLGTILYNAGDKDKQKSNAGLQRLLMMGRHPSVKTFVSNAAKAIEDPQTIDTFTKNIQSKIERVMNQKLGAERKSAENQPAGPGPTGELGKSAGLAPEESPEITF